MTAGRESEDSELRLASRAVGGGLRQVEVSVPDIHCGGCIQRIERALSALPDIEFARVNLSTKRVVVRWREAANPPLLHTLRTLGYAAHFDDAAPPPKDDGLGELLRALAVAGFAAMNIMLLSVSVWSGAEPATRDLFHALSALIALPALVYSGRIFFRSAWRSLRHGRTNMDVPISIGVLLAFGLSLHETLVGGPHAYFDAAVTLLFFLLIGRTLDHAMRERTRTAVAGLARLAARGAEVLQPDGTRDYVPVQQIAPGMTIRLKAGDRVPVDARVIDGDSDIDTSLVTGESLPAPATIGARLHAGTLNLSGPLTVVATAAAADSFLAEMIRMMEAAESGRSRYRRLADRVSRLYAPVVHLAALLTGIGWMIALGDLHRALTVAIAVLIITCPCAIALAVPMVQVMAARRLFEAGVMVKDGGALERLAAVDTVVFDKTGTLTLGEPQLVGIDADDPAAPAIAAALAGHSCHPYSRALAAAAPAAGSPPVELAGIAEHPGAGLEARVGGALYRLGRPSWALPESVVREVDGRASVVLACDGRRLASFRFADRLRPDAAEAVRQLAGQGLAVEILSGDRAAAVADVGAALDLPHAAEVSPGDKAARVASGGTALMVGDGLNDAPALAAAHVSMAPASAADVGRNAADLVFLRESLAAVPLAVEVARRAARLARQNLGLALAYNVIAVPIAVAGAVTPLIAAIAMSVSSLVVVANALRLGRLQAGITDRARAASGRNMASAVPAARAG